MYITPLILKPPMCNGLFTLTDPDSDSNTDSNPIPVVGSEDWNLNLTSCSVKSSK